MFWSCFFVFVSVFFRWFGIHNYNKRRCFIWLRKISWTFAINMLTKSRNFKRCARASLINERNRTEFAWNPFQNNEFSSHIANGLKCFMLIVTILCLCLKLKHNHSHEKNSLNGFIINWHGNLYRYRRICAIFGPPLEILANEKWTTHATIATDLIYKQIVSFFMLFYVFY